MVTLIYETHSTSLDNVKKISSGWYDVQLSELGKKQSIELGERYKSSPVDAVFCSDLGRSLQTAAIAFGGNPLFADPQIIYVDWRLRECNYGDFTRRPSKLVEEEKLKRIKKPFPNGESYEDCIQRMKSFLNDIKATYPGKRVLVIGHAATRHCLEHLIENRPIEECIAEVFKWQPGWKYILN